MRLLHASLGTRPQLAAGLVLVNVLADLGMRMPHAGLGIRTLHAGLGMRLLLDGLGMRPLHTWLSLHRAALTSGWTGLLQ